MRDAVEMDCRLGVEGRLVPGAEAVLLFDFYRTTPMPDPATDEDMVLSGFFVSRSPMLTSERHDRDPEFVLEAGALGVRHAVRVRVLPEAVPGTEHEVMLLISHGTRHSGTVQRRVRVEEP